MNAADLQQFVKYKPLLPGNIWTLNERNQPIQIDAMDYTNMRVKSGINLKNPQIYDKIQELYKEKSISCVFRNASESCIFSDRNNE